MYLGKSWTFSGTQCILPYVPLVTRSLGGDGVMFLSCPFVCVCVRKYLLAYGCAGGGEFSSFIAFHRPCAGLVQRDLKDICEKYPLHQDHYLRGAEYCGDHVLFCLCVCVSAGISVELHVRSSASFYACCLWPWFGPALAASQ